MHHFPRGLFRGRNFAFLLLVSFFIGWIALSVPRNCFSPKQVAAQSKQVSITNCQALIQHLQSAVTSRIILENNFVCDWDDPFMNQEEIHQPLVDINHVVEISSTNPTIKTSTSETKEETNLKIIEIISSQKPSKIIISMRGILKINGVLLFLNTPCVDPDQEMDVFTIDNRGQVHITNSILMIKRCVRNQKENVTSFGEISKTVTSPTTKTKILEDQKLILGESSSSLSSSLDSIEKVIFYRSILLGKGKLDLLRIPTTSLQSSKATNPEKQSSQAQLSEVDGFIESKSVVAIHEVLEIFSRETGEFVIALAIGSGALALFCLSFNILHRWRRTENKQEKELRAEKEEIRDMEEDQPLRLQQEQQQQQQFFENQEREIENLTRYGETDRGKGRDPEEKTVSKTVGSEDSDFSLATSLSSSSSSSSSEVLASTASLPRDPVVKSRGDHPAKELESSPDIGKGLLLELESVLGYGKNAKVYKGTYDGKPVAIKVSERIGSKKQAVNEPLEVKILRHLHHPNVVEFVTCVKHIPSQDKALYTSERFMTTTTTTTTTRARAKSQAIRNSSQGMKLNYQTLIIMEYCDSGNLYEEMKRCRQTGDDALPGENPQMDGLTIDCVIRCGIDISRAMEQVHAKRIVHRALHPKNILLKSTRQDPRGYICKLGGFGSSYRLSHGSSSIQDNKVKHIAMAAPEVLCGGQLSLESDVYAFGVLLCALFTGWMPFHCLTNNELRRSVVSGIRPKIPQHVPARISELITSCWSSVRNERPMFTQITLLLEDFLKSVKQSMKKIDPSVPTTSTLTPMSESTSPIPSVVNLSQDSILCPTVTEPALKDAQSDKYMENLIPGNSYIHIQFQSAKVAHKEQNKKRDHRPSHSRSLSDASTKNRRCARAFIRERSNSVLPESSDEAFVRSVDDLLKRSRASDSKNELRQFLSAIALNRDSKHRLTNK